jgi:hypothetical protein
MKLFSMSWFKTEKQLELEALKVEQQKLKNKLLEEQIKEFTEDDEREEKELNWLKEEMRKAPIQVFNEKPYKSIKLINDVLTIILQDGSILSKPNSNQQDFQDARNAETEEELLKIGSSVEGIEEKKAREKEFQKNLALSKGISILEDSGDFIVKDGSVYMKEVESRSLPTLLVNQFILLFDKYEGLDVQETDEYQSLKKFWLKCCLNPNAQSAEDLYTFLSNHHFKIDKHGNFYAYRRVVSKGAENQKLVEFVSNAYTKVKAVWKKKPADYTVFSNDDEGLGFTSNVLSIAFQSKNNTVLGNLETLYLDLPNMQEKAYTSAHTGREDYRVGEIVSMPRQYGDDNNTISCSKGFHAASKEYDYSGFGDTPILVIINPMDVLAVPLNEVGKLRTSRWFFAATLDNEEQYILDDDEFDVTDLGDVFEEKCLSNIETYVKNSFAEEVQRHTFSIPQISASELTSAIHTLEKMKAAISNRIEVVWD